MRFLRKILAPFSALYGSITSTRNTLYDKGVLKSTVFKTPIIVVGNLSVGGTGKTPQIEYLVRLLQKKYTIAILSRGYKRTSKGFLIADKNTKVETIGDEPMQYFLKFKNITIAVDADRVNGITQLASLEKKPNVILLDDAFQHRKVEAGLNILLTSYNDLYIDDKMLPAGNLREHVVGANRAQIIVVSKCPEDLNEKEQFEITKKLHVGLHQTVFFSKISYGSLIIGAHSTLSIAHLPNYKVILVTGIANTKPLEVFLDAKHVDYQHLKFTDHHHFSANELQKITAQFSEINSDKKLILTTEKDYVRSFKGVANFYYLPIETTFINHQIDFNTLVKKYVEQGTADS